MYDHTEYKVGLGIDFEIFMKETLGTFCTPIGGIKCREERREEYRCHTVTPDLLFETNGDSMWTAITGRPCRMRMWNWTIPGCTG